MRPNPPPTFTDGDPMKFPGDPALEIELDSNWLQRLDLANWPKGYACFVRTRPNGHKDKYIYGKRRTCIYMMYMKKEFLNLQIQAIHRDTVSTPWCHSPHTSNG